MPGATRRRAIASFEMEQAGKQEAALTARSSEERGTDSATWPTASGALVLAGGSP